MKKMLERSEIVDMQRQLTSFIGVSGREQDVADFILSKIKLYTDKAWKDPLGNILAIKEGKKENGLKILLDAHMDEVGLIIRHIDDKGYLHFSPLGGIDQRVYPSSRVLLRTKKNHKLVSGIIGLPPPHITEPEERKKSLSHDKLFIDIGADSKEEVKELGIDVGTTGVLDIPFEYIESRGILRGRGFDDRTGCNVLLQVAKMLKDSMLENTMVFSFSIGEEVGGRGAKATAFSLNPDIAIALENTIAADLPNVPESMCPTKLNNGPAITVADKSIVCDERLVDHLKNTAQELNISWQYKKPTFGGTNAGVIHVTRKGIPSAVVSVPCRYIHSPFGQLKVLDLENTINLVYAAITSPISL